LVLQGTSGVPVGAKNPCGKPAGVPAGFKNPCGFPKNMPKGLYHKGRLKDRKTQAGKPFAAQMDGHPQERNGKTERRIATTEKLFSNQREKCSVLPPFFLLLVRGSNQIIGQSNYTPTTKKREQKLLSEPVYQSYRKLKRGIVQCRSRKAAKLTAANQSRCA